MLKFLVICIRLYMAGFRISRAVFVGQFSGLHRFYWDYGKKVEVLDMPDIDWFIDSKNVTHYSLMYQGKSTKIN